MSKTRQVALIMNVNKTYDRKVVAGIARYVHEVGHWSIYVEDEPLDRMPNLQEWKGHGIIADLDDESVVDAVKGLKIPVVGVGGLSSSNERPDGLGYVATDNEMIGHMAADHLIERGFKHFAYCGVPRTTCNPWVEHRRIAFKKRVADAGFKCAEYFGRHTTVRQWDALQEGLTEWLAGLQRPLALFACNDARARHALEACRRIQARVPDDVAVLGVDNDELICDLAEPSLSSVIQGGDEIGYKAAALLDKMMHGRKPAVPWMVVPPVGIATRRSTDTMAIDDQQVAEALKYIRLHIAEGVQVSEIASHLKVSRSTLDNRFKRVLGRTAHDEIERLRVQIALELLQQTSLPQKQVAQRAGFNNVQYMTMVLRRQTQETPGNIRKKVRRM